MNTTSTTLSTLIVEVLYMLSWDAQFEHPHMICVPYPAHQQGPTLKDVKACMIALRGKGMLNLFSWSYKRNIKDSFIWCDLFDDDCILSLNTTGAYVLKVTKKFDALLPVDNLDKPSKLLAKPKHCNIEDDVSMAIKKSLLLINTPRECLDLNKQIMKNLLYSKTEPDVCSIENSKSSSSSVTNNPSLQDIKLEKKKHSKLEKHNFQTIYTKRLEEKPISQATIYKEPSPIHIISTSNVDRKEHDKELLETQRVGRVSTTETNNVSLEMAQQDVERKVKLDCNQLQVEVGSKFEFPCKTSTKTLTKRKTWEKNIDKCTICAQLVSQRYSDNEQSNSFLLNECNAFSKRSFISFEVLEKATQVDSNLWPHLCQIANTVDTTCIQTKVHFQNKSGSENDKSPHASYFVEDYPFCSIHIKDFETLPKYFEAQKKQTPLNICKELMSGEPISQNVENIPLKSLVSSQVIKAQVGDLDPQFLVSNVTKNVATTPIRPSSRPFSNEALNASYKKTMEVLAKLPTS